MRSSGGVLPLDPGLQGGLLLDWGPVSCAGSDSEVLDILGSGSWEEATVISSHSRPSSPVCWFSLSCFREVEFSITVSREKKVLDETGLQMQKEAQLDSRFAALLRSAKGISGS